jgi:hypothetical protein
MQAKLVRAAKHILVEAALLMLGGFLTWLGLQPEKVFTLITGAEHAQEWSAWREWVTQDAARWAFVVLGLIFVAAASFHLAGLYRRRRDSAAPSLAEIAAHAAKLAESPREAARASAVSSQAHTRELSPEIQQETWQDGQVKHKLIMFLNDRLTPLIAAQRQARDKLIELVRDEVGVELFGYMLPDLRRRWTDDIMVIQMVKTAIQIEKIDLKELGELIVQSAFQYRANIDVLNRIAEEYVKRSQKNLPGDLSELTTLRLDKAARVCLDRIRSEQVIKDYLMAHAAFASDYKTLTKRPSLGPFYEQSGRTDFGERLEITIKGRIIYFA